MVILKIYPFVNYKVNVPVTVNIATVQDPHVDVVLQPGATAKLPGLQAVAILNITIPLDPAPPVEPHLLPPPPLPVLATAAPPAAHPGSEPSPPPPTPPDPPLLGCPPPPPPAKYLPGAGPGSPLPGASGTLPKIVVGEPIPPSPPAGPVPWAPAAPAPPPPPVAESGEGLLAPPGLPSERSVEDPPAFAPPPPPPPPPEAPSRPCLLVAQGWNVPPPPPPAISTSPIVVAVPSPPAGCTPGLPGAPAPPPPMVTM